MTEVTPAASVARTLPAQSASDITINKRKLLALLGTAVGPEDFGLLVVPVSQQVSTDTPASSESLIVGTPPTPSVAQLPIPSQNTAQLGAQLPSQTSNSSNLQSESNKSTNQSAEPKQFKVVLVNKDAIQPDFPPLMENLLLFPLYMLMNTFLLCILIVLLLILCFGLLLLFRIKLCGVLLILDRVVI